MKLTIEIPGLPPKECSPNARVHWTAKAQAAREWRNSVFYAAVDARNNSGNPKAWKNLARAKLSVTFIFNDKRRRDMDNLIAAMKPGIDGLVGCIIEDDSTDHISVAYSGVRGDMYQTIVEVRCEED